ncbi:hypothetical protein NAT51_11975 [Flavobacterium amniphilum]|uniref:hypothetical protein n=1 Tax=Flavobacterium amniphilum TaxID=1834035 RepID=UPI00202AA8DC|nr:hypothetical protein [Flavobacterium amniphilum]MCL9806245.1 hypothetical protein [Flavobacterium amniphilum]
MKRFLVFTAVLLSSISKTFACGYSPYGEDVRYSLFLPEYFGYNDFKPFYYDSQLFGFNFEYDNSFDSNIYDWYYFTGKKVTLDEIDECMGSLTFTDINTDSKNGFVHFLYQNKMNNVINYLKMAKKCEAVNSLFYEDEWERDTPEKNLHQLAFLKKLKQAVIDEKNEYLKRKYAFLAIRTSYYIGNGESMSSLFDMYFKNGKKDYLYYWSLFFNSFTKDDKSIDVANIMAYSPEKKYAVYYYFHNDFNLQKALAKAKSKQEIANVHAYASVQKISPNLESLKKIYDNSHKSRILDFLLLREINKIEDWIFTPYYTNYLPSIDSADNWYEGEEVVESTNTLRNRSEKDRLYAKMVLDFVNSADLSKVENPVLWNASQIQLLFMTRNYAECLNRIHEFEKKHSKEKIFQQVEKIKALCVISDQGFGKAIVKDEIKPIILKYKSDERFLFSLGRELEFRGNIADGMALISFGNSISEYYLDYDASSGVEWQGNRLKSSGNLKYFYKYFDYLDFVYSAKEMQIVINKLNQNKTSRDIFQKIIYSQLLKDKDQLTDLLGTKYIRENRLIAAELAFRSIGEKYWNDNYNAWERDEYGEYYSFEENPFYDFKHTENFIPHTEKYLVTKLSVTQHLIKYLKLANNPKTKDRDYYYFIIANCYVNMSQYGHSWMMRRYESTSDYREEEVYNESYIDETDYRNSNLAQQYYRLAYENAKTDKFKALCLRMIDFAKSNYPNDFKKLRSRYPEFYNDLSNCEHLEEYFKSR